jgi:hypothetical protein
MIYAGTPFRRYGPIGAAAIVALALLVVFFPWNALRGPLVKYASARLHRVVSIGGDLDVELGLTTRVRVDGLAIGNAEWSKEPQMATAERVTLSFGLASLLRGRPDHVRLVEPKLLLERSVDGDANWRFDGNTGGVALRIGGIDVDHGVVRYVDPTLHADITANLQTAGAIGETPLTLRFNGSGTLRGGPFSLEGEGHGLDQLRNLDDPYRLVLDARAGATKLRFEGTVVPAQPENLRGDLHLRGADLSDLYPIVPAPLPWTPPYDLTGHLTHANSQWVFRQISGTVGHSDLAGDFTVDRSAQRTLTTAELSSRSLDYKDLGGFIGLPPGETAGRAKTAAQQKEVRRRAARRGVLPDKPFDFEKLRDHDVEVTFQGRSVKWGALPIDHLVAHLVLKNGILHFEPLDFGIADGHVVSDITLDATRMPATAQAQVEVRNVELKRIFPKLASPRGTAGRVGGRAHFRTRGDSVAQLFAAGDGEGALAMRGGEASTLQVVLTNLDLARAAALMLHGDESAQIHCAVAAVHAKDGVMTPDLFVIDTSAELITGDGDIDFRNEKYGLELKADSKHPSILALRGPIVIGGTFAAPVVHPKMGPVAARIGAAVGLGLLAPPLALLPLIDLGDASDVDCKWLRQEARISSGR